jgi:hypothetical protein
MQNARIPQMELIKMINFKNSLRPHVGSRSFPQKRRPRELPIAYKSKSKAKKVSI